MFFIVLFQTKHGREQLDKVLKKSFVNFYFWGITLKQKDNSLKHFKMANPNSSWAYIREGLLSDDFLHPRFGGLIFGRAYFWRGLLSEFYSTLKFQ